MATVMKDERRQGDPAAEAAAKVESDIREFVRRDQFAPRRLREGPAAALPNAPQLPDAKASPQTTNEINDLIRRVSGGSMEEIDRVIQELQSVREMLRSEGERVTREISGYASLNAAAMTAMKIIAESMTQWKTSPMTRDGDR